MPENVKAIGVFGFLSSYKGFETAIRAMRYLPEDYHLYIFGGVHPNDIPEKRVQTYVKKLMSEVTTDYTLLDRLLGKMPESNADPADLGDLHKGAGSLSSPVHLSVDSIAHAHGLVKGMADSLVNRVHFVGALTDEQFYGAMASCDVVVLPYQEVMQSSSGPASLAIELGRRTLLSRTRGFLQLGRYFPNRLEFFDVGNHLQLVSLIRDTTKDRAYPERLVSMETLCQLYVSVHSDRRSQDREVSVNKDIVVTEVEAVPAQAPAARVDDFDIQVGNVGELVSDTATRSAIKREKRLLKRGFLKPFSSADTTDNDGRPTH